MAQHLSTIREQFRRLEHLESHCQPRGVVEPPLDSSEQYFAAARNGVDFMFLAFEIFHHQQRRDFTLANSRAQLL